MGVLECVSHDMSFMRVSFASLVRSLRFVSFGFVSFRFVSLRFASSQWPKILAALQSCFGYSVTSSKTRAWIVTRDLGSGGVSWEDFTC